jgi:signal transduction histidine kinase
MLLLMEANSSQETIPYHVMFLALTLVYGFRVWPMAATAVVALLVTLATSWVFLRHYAAGQIDSAELAEVPLMPTLFMAMVWHARRRVSAQREVERMADERRAGIDREREFFRDASHAIRTPVTIAQGHLELALPAVEATTPRDDIRVALRQLDRMSALSNRLLALAQLDAGIPLRRSTLDLRTFVEGVGHDWSSTVDRRWAVLAPADVTFSADAEWLGLAVDALVENAVHFTRDGGSIELRGAAAGGRCIITVTDDGPGIGPEDLPHVFDRFWHRVPVSGQPGSGLGLALVMATARAHGGTATVSSAAGGGSTFAIALPCVTTP